MDFDKLNENIRARNNKLEGRILKPYATLSKDAKRKRAVYRESLRPNFCRDADRIIHSFSFARSADKTQVFFWVDSDLFQHRLMHVQLVSKIGRYIAKILGLNEDLTEAISLGHDIGHCPFGHDGERFLSRICQENGIGYFRHNLESVWFLKEIEMLNLTLQTLDGILSHNGELHEKLIKPDSNNLSWKALEKRMNIAQFNEKTPNIIPNTMEGILVRYVDTISYISRDIREAESLNIIGFRDLPNRIKINLGKNNREILNTLISDLIENSIDHNYIAYSEDIFNTLLDLYEFNFNHIYNHPKKKKAYNYLEKSFRLLWDIYLEDLYNENMDSEIYFDHFLLNFRDIKDRLVE
ncbi:MAG: HD domain-containing protein, partial [Candidatus Lokiarchaeota archaeon]|nr:HD domain-containing protein [Candidatus Lokiarchaeota archaeon]